MTTPLAPPPFKPSRFEKAAAFIQLGRLKFLLYSPILYGLGAALATGRTGKLDPWMYGFGLVLVWISHAMTHYCNEYFDYEADVANLHATPFTGGSRVLVNGLLARKVALRTALVLTAVSVVMTVALPTKTAKLVALVAISLAWMYSTPPFRLVGRGLGEFTVVVVLNFLTPLFGYVVQGASIGRGLFAIALPLGIIGYVRMLIMSIPDREGDAAAGKRTVVVRIGTDAVIRIHNVGMLVAYSSLLGFVPFGLPSIIAACVAVTAPIAVWQSVRLSRGAWKSSAMLRSIPFWASTHNALAALMALFGSLLAQGTHLSSLHVQLFPAYLYLGSLGYFAYKARI